MRAFARPTNEPATQKDGPVARRKLRARSRLLKWPARVAAVGSFPERLASETDSNAARSRHDKCFEYVKKRGYPCLASICDAKRKHAAPFPALNIPPVNGPPFGVGPRRDAILFRHEETGARARNYLEPCVT